MKKVFLATIGFAILAVAAFAANVGDFESVPNTPGFFVQGYPAYVTASKIYDADGESQDLANNWKGFSFAVRPSYCGTVNNHRWTLSAVVPYASYDLGVGETQSGISDVQVSAAYWLWDNRNNNYLSVWFWTDVPTGDDEKGLGTGQMNLRPGLAYSWDKYPYQVQTSAFYNLRMKNSDTELKPGDEIWANFSVGYSFQPNFMLGAELESSWGQDEKLNSVTVTDSKENSFKVGPSVQYQLMPNLGFKVKGLYTAFGKNTPQTFDIWARLSYSFGH